jgi:pSer/pThr/pTyr-binding forkhead associated (FHA) protein
LSKAQWVLTLRYGDETFTLESAGSFRIGREKGSDIVVPTQHASRLHARVFGRDGNFVIADQSSNGTFVMVDGSTREIRLRREEAVLGERGIIGLGSPTTEPGDHLLQYRVQRRGGER